MGYDDLKNANGKVYSGMHIGGTHDWHYTNCEFHEQKVAPDKYRIHMSSIKKRHVPAPAGSGVPIGTEYHWFWIAGQRVIKTSDDEYQTVLDGNKYKLGHKRPYWKAASYDYPEQNSLKQQVLTYLRACIAEVEKADDISNSEAIYKLGKLGDGIWAKG